jgi:hypothetical protein
MSHGCPTGYWVILGELSLPRSILQFSHSL